MVYSRAGIPRYWIINLVERQVEVYADPAGQVQDSGYRQRSNYRPGQTVPLLLDGQLLGNINVADLLPWVPVKGHGLY